MPLQLIVLQDDIPTSSAVIFIILILPVMIAIKLSSTCVVYGTVPVSLLVSPLRDLPVFFLCWSVFQHCILNPVLLFHNAVALCSINSFPVTLWGMRIVPRSSALFSLQYFIALIHTQKPLIYIYIYILFYYYFLIDCATIGVQGKEYRCIYFQLTGLFHI